MKKKILFRTDGNSEIGLGHLVRCISLAHMLKDEFEIAFYCMHIPDQVKKEIKQKGWSVEILENESVFLNLLSNQSFVVLDGYHFDSGYQKRIKNKKARLVCIDDYHNQHFYADLVINHAPGINEMDYSGEDYTKYLLGLDYALLRPEFLEPASANKKMANNQIEHLFICFGGSDKKNLTCSILSWLPKKNYQITIVTGHAYLHEGELNRVVKSRSDFRITVKKELSAQDMRNEILKADLAIVPASGILFEVIATNTPVISGYYIDNQKKVYFGFKKIKAIIGIDDFKKEKLIRKLNKINYNKINLNVLDGHSHERIMNIILSL